MKRFVISISVILLFISYNSYSQTWVPNSNQNSLVPHNSNNNLTPIKIGIGTANPTEQLHTTDGVRFEGVTNNNALRKVLMQDNLGRLYWRDIFTFPSQEIIKVDTTINNYYYAGDTTINIYNNYTGSDADWYLLKTTNQSPDNINSDIYTFGNVVIGNQNYNKNFDVNSLKPRLTIDNGMLYIGGSTSPDTLNEYIISSFQGWPKSGLQLGNESDYMGMVLERIGFDNHNAVIYFGGEDSKDALKFSTADWNGTNHKMTEKMRLTQNGHLGIGVNNPQSALEVAFGSSVGGYNNSGWWHSSDKRLKTNIVSITSPMSILKGINGVYYNYVNSSDITRQVGVIAQEVQKVLPEVVVGKEGDINNYETLGVVYDGMIPVLIEAVKEKDNEISKLKQQLSAIEKALIDKGILSSVDVSNEESNLQQNIPNPFEKETIINYTIAKSGNVKIEIFDINGKFVKMLVDEYKDKGDYFVKINGENLSTGKYFYKLTLDDIIITRSAIKK